MPTRLVADVATGEVREVEKTAEEIAQDEVDRQEAEAAQAQIDARRPDFGDDATAPEQLKTGVEQLRAYLAIPSPTGPQTVAALKLTIRGLLFLLRRSFS